MDVLEAIRTRRSIREFLPRPVDRELIESVVGDAARAPPPFAGEVPWTFNVVEGVEQIADLGAQALHYAREQHAGEPGWEWVDRPDFKVFWNAPAVIVISGRLADCARAGQNLMLSAHGRGLGACWVGSPLSWLATSEAKLELSIPNSLTPGAALCLGYPARVPPPPDLAAPPIIWAS